MLALVTSLDAAGFSRNAIMTFYLKIQILNKRILQQNPRKREQNIIGVGGTFLGLM